MSSDDDSDNDRHLFSGGLTIPSRNNREERKAIQDQPRVILNVANSSDSSESEDEIEVMPPINNAKKPAPPSSVPQLTATGSNPHDPVIMADVEFSDDSSSDGFDSSLAQRLARRIEIRNSCSTQSTQDHLMRDTSTSSVNSAHSNLSNGFSPYIPQERATSSQETAFSIEHKVQRLEMISKETSMSSSESSSDDEMDLAQSIACIDQRKRESATKYASFDSDSDSDDSLLAVTQVSISKSSYIAARPKNPILKQPSVKANEKSRAKELREQVRREKQLAKEKDKQERQQQRIAKQAAAQAEKENRKRRRIESDQTSGKRANEEIAVLMELTLCNHEELTVMKDLQESGFLVDSYPSGLGCDVVQFIRSDYVSGGGVRAVEMLKHGKREEYQHLPIVGVVFHDPMNFISKIERDVHDEDDDYPKLESFLKGLEHGWRAAWKVSPECRPRVIFYLNNVNGTLDKLWVKSRRKDQSMKPPPTGEELQDSLIWLSVQFCVDCIHYSCPEDLSTQLTKMAVWLAREPYQRQMTDLECAKKTKMQCSDMDPPLVRSQDCWRRQLCQVPGISESMASSVVGYFPTMRSLYLRYQDPSLTESQKVLLLSDCFGREGRKDVKCSDAVYRILTSKNPNELI